ncbi:MAG: hypothetical protein M9924_10585 [Rhizobiaceae bacterium]|nr:hypothetical protein [Rhizobiaceae bacterium]
MSDRGTAAAARDETDSVLTFRDIFNRLWTCRALLVLLPFLGICAAALAVLADSASNRQIISYHVKLIGIENGNYPNATAFSPADLKSSTVLTALAERFHIGTDRLEQAIGVSYDDPAAAGIERKYQQKLATRGLQPADIDAINSDYLAELSAAMNSGLRIEVNNDLLGLSSREAIALAFAVPATWNDVFVKRYRVLASSDLSEASISSVPKQPSGTVALLLVGEQLDRIEAGVAIISEDNRLAGLTTPDGLTAQELANLIREFRTIEYNPLLAGGFPPTDPVAVALRSQLVTKSREIAGRIEGIDRNLNRLFGETRSRSPENGFTSGPLLDQGALDKVVELVERASYVAYVRDLMDKRQQLVGQMSRLNARQDAIIIRDAGSVLPEAGNLPETAKRNLDMLTSKYRDLFSLAQRKLFESSGTFYAARSTPTDRGSLYSALVVVALGGVAGFVLAMLYALLMPAFRAAIAKGRNHASRQLRVIASGETT